MTLFLNDILKKLDLKIFFYFEPLLL